MYQALYTFIAKHFPHYLHRYIGLKRALDFFSSYPKGYIIPSQDMETLLAELKNTKIYKHRENVVVDAKPLYLDEDAEDIGKYKGDHGGHSFFNQCFLLESWVIDTEDAEEFWVAKDCLLLQKSYYTFLHIHHSPHLPKIGKFKNPLWLNVQQYLQEPHSSFLYHRRLPKEKMKIDKPIMLMANFEGFNNLSHFIVDIIPKYYLTKKILPNFPDDCFYHTEFRTKHKILEFNKEILHRLGIDTNRLLTQNNMNYYSDRILACYDTLTYNFGFMSKSYLNTIKNLFQDIAPSNNPRYKKIYISRKDVSSRRVINEEEIVAYLTTLGFTTIYMNKYSFLEHIAIFKSAEIIIAPHGAAMMNILFCQKNINLIECFSKSDIRQSFFQLASVLNFHYALLIGSEYDDNGDYTIQLDKLSRLVKKMSIH